MSVATRRAIYGKLAGDSTLTGLLGAPATNYTQSIYYQVAPAGAKFPYIIFSKQAGTPTYTFQTGQAAFDAEVWLVKGVDQATSADTADAIASRLTALLTDGALSISGSTQMYLRRESDVDYSEEDKGQLYRHAGALFRLVHQVT